MRRGAATVIAWGLCACGRIGFDPVDNDNAVTATFEGAVAAASPAELTFPISVDAAGANRALAVFTHIGTRCGQQEPTVASVTFAGVALTRVRRETNALCVGMSSDLWALPPGTQPATEQHDVVITLTSNLTHLGSLEAGAVSVQNVDPAMTFTSSTGANGQGTLAAITLPASGANDLVLHSACSGSAIAGTPQTMQWISNFADYNGCNNNGGASAPGGTTDLSWTISPGYWVMIGASFRSDGLAAATLDATATGYVAGAFDRYRVPFTFSAKPHRALVVFTHTTASCDGALPEISVAYAGIPLVTVHTQANPFCNSNVSLVWAFPPGTEPPGGTNPLEVVVTPHLGDSSVHVGAVFASGVDSAMTFSAIGGAAGRDTLATLELPPSGPDDLVAYSVCNGTDLEAASGFERWRQIIVEYTSCDNDGGATAPGGTTTLSWAGPDDTWNIVGVAFKAAHDE